MATKYNIDSDNQQYFLNINILSLPMPIRTEFEEVFKCYEVFNVELIDQSIQKVAINSMFFDRLKELLDSDELFVTLHPNIIIDQQATVREIFNEIKYKNLTYYNIKNIEYLQWFNTITYSKAFICGYCYDFNSDYEIFSTVSKKMENGSLDNYEDILDENYSFPVIHSSQYECFAEDEGKYIRAWDEILQRPIDFEVLFSQAQISYSANQLEWNGKPTELMELIKALIESRSIKGGSQKEIVSTFSTFFGIEIKNPDKLIQDIKNRSNGSETLFLEKLKTSLFDYIQK